MSAPTGPVLVASALVSSPILWLVYEGSISTEVALQRWVICAAVCWVAISVISALAFPSSRPEPQVAEVASESRAGAVTE